jgi:hypothetical protein
MDRTGRTTSAAADSVRITSAQSSHSERIRGRQTRYLVSMGVRTVCFVLAVVTDGTLRWVFIVGAVVLPYFAVIVANASGEVDRDVPDPFYDDSRLMLEAGPRRGPDDAGAEPRGEGAEGVRAAGAGEAAAPRQERSTDSDGSGRAEAGKYRQNPSGQ